ncbi:uncharacterized protein [Nicotiana sylvestris]|uniref:uncharacterized protein n=1 Tax=Nicotiana sylvestris TaxID=4096 RepID=UPI00388C54D5
MQIDNQHKIQQSFLLPSAMISNNEDEVNMELIPITSNRIKEIAESSCASQKSRKRVRRKLKESTILEINQKVEFTAVRSFSKRYELKCIVDKCGWNVRATRIKNSTLFRVIKYHNTHECSVDARKLYQKQATSNFISEQIIEHVRDKKIEVTPAFVENEMKKKFGIDIGYHKAWRAIQKVVACIRGTPEENYQIIPSYLHMMVDKNPGTFAYMFFAPATSIAGWSYCRPIIAVDATFLKSKYRGVLFVAVSKDANNQIFPLFFGVADLENNEAYIWFLGEMRKAIQVIMNYFSCHIETNRLQMRLEKFFLKLTMMFNLDSMLFRINSEGIEFIVDLKKRTCDCLEFQLDELPCPHAIAAINKRYLQKSDYCSNWYSREK